MEAMEANGKTYPPTKYRKLNDTDVTVSDLIRGKRWRSVMERIRSEGGRDELLRGRPPPLHLAVHEEIRAPVAIVRAILRECPEAAGAVAEVTVDFPPLHGPHGPPRPVELHHCVPLHVACSHAHPTARTVQVVRLLLDAHPGGSRAETRQHWLPLHVACAILRPSADVVRLLLEEHPDGSQARHEFDVPPLHRLLRGYQRSPDVVRLVLDAHAEGAQTTDSLGRLPLHCAVLFDHPLDTLRMLVDAFPGGAIVCDGDGDLPFHHFSHKENEDSPTPDKNGVKKVELLLRPILEDEDLCTLSASWGGGKTPLQIAAEVGALKLHTCVGMETCPPNVILRVAILCPDQLALEDGEKNCPLHIAAANRHLNGGKAVICGDGAETAAANDNDSTVAKDEEANEEAEDLMSALVKLHPDAAKKSNRAGQVPLFLALKSGKTWGSGVSAIVDAAGYMVTRKDNSTNLYPFMLAAVGEESCLTTVYCLFRCCPELKKYV